MCCPPRNGAPLGNRGASRSVARSRIDGAPADRQTDPIDALAVSAVGRVPALLAIKWQRMAASPFGFFRGAVAIMAADLAVLPHTGIFTQLCGDAHVRNLGAYAAPDGRLVFDINDFDETIRGPFEWDVKRLATSIVLAGREAVTRAAPVLRRHPCCSGAIADLCTASRA